MENLVIFNIFRVLNLNIIIALIFFISFVVLNSFQVTKAANITFIFLIFFNTYGLIYRYLVDIDIVRIKHYNLLPLILMMATYIGLLIAKLNDSFQKTAWKYLVMISSFLLLFNLVNIISAEVKKWKVNTADRATYTTAEFSVDINPPDIYYIVLDEFVGFEAMREYWHYEEVDDFVKYLNNRGFFVAEASHGTSRDTMREIASRLNFQEYPNGTSKGIFLSEIADNQVIRYLKSRGYTTVVFSEMKLAYPSSLPIHADYSYEYGDPSIPVTEMGTDVYGLYLDEFGELVMNNTMFYAVPQTLRSYTPLVTQHTSMVQFTVDNVANNDITTPKFVYVHLLLPHTPFVYDRYGNILDSIYRTNWNYYLESYIYSISLAKEMINNIQDASDPANPPVIILQSDHGARNSLGEDEGSQILSNYPEEYKTLILNTLYLPGYDFSSLPQDINPTNTFPVVFNHLFNTNIPLIK